MKYMIFAVIALCIIGGCEKRDEWNDMTNAQFVIDMGPVNDHKDLIGSQGVPYGHPPLLVHRDGFIVVLREDKERCEKLHPDWKYSDMGEYFRIDDTEGAEKIDDLEPDQPDDKTPPDYE